MENFIEVDALCLRCLDYGENDAILTLCAMGRGKISVSAKGIKKPKARLKFAASPFCFARYSLAVKGDKFILTGCETHDIFFDIYAKLDAFYAGFCVLEILDKCVLDEAEDALLSDAVRAINALCYSDADAGRVLSEFFYKTICEGGFSLKLSNCQSCEIALENEAYLATDGGFYCKNCSKGATYINLNDFKAVKVFCNDIDSGKQTEGLTRNDFVQILRFLAAYIRRTLGFTLKSFEEFLKVYKIG